MAHVLDSQPPARVPEDAAPSGVAPAASGTAERAVVLATALAAGALFAAAALLWARDGATLFFDIMNAGIGSCL